MNKGYIKRIGSQTVDVQLYGSASTLSNVAISGQIDATSLVVGTAVLVDIVNGQHVVLHTLTNDNRSPATTTGSSSALSGVLLADGSIPLIGNLSVTPGVTIDGYDVSVLGQTIDNLQAADSVTRTGHTVLTHASHLVASIGPDDTEVLIRAGIFSDKETLVVSNTMGEVEFMQVVGNPVAVADDKGALCYRYTVTRQVATSPNGIITGWAAATLVNGLTHKGYISVDARENSIAAPNLRFVLHTDIDAGTTEQIVRMGNVYGILGNEENDYGFAVGRLNTGDRYLHYNYNRNLLALRGADIAVSDDEGVEVFRVWGTAEDDYSPGNTRLGKASGGHIETKEDRVDFYAGSQRIMYVSSDGSRFRGMIWSGTQPGPQVGIGEESGYGYIVARNIAGVNQFVVRTDEDNVHIHMGNPVELGGYAEFTDGGFTTDGVIRARSFQLLGGGYIEDGIVLENNGRVVAGSGNNVAVLDGEDLTWRIYAGNANPAIAPFRVNQQGEAWLTNAHVSGELTALSGTVGGWVINGDSLSKNNTTLHSGGYLNLGTGNDVARIDASNSIYRLWVGHADAATAPFSVTKWGALLASNATITGTITANGGSIAGWTIAEGHLYTGSGTGRTGLRPVDFPFYAGGEDPAQAQFRVSSSGVLTANEAYITGTINAGAGDITGNLYVGSSDPRIVIDGTRKFVESTNFASGTSGFRLNGVTGDAEFNNITARGVLAVSVLQYGYILATNGTIWVTRAAGRTLSALAVPGGASSAIDVEDPEGMPHSSAGALWLTGHVIRVREPMIGDYWGTVSSKTDMGTYWRLTITKQYSFGSGTIPIGAAILNYGTSGDGVVRITADANDSPYISIATHSGSPWTTLTERARLGNLTGISGASGYGLWTDNGYFTGTVYANAGLIGGWTIEHDRLITSTVGMSPADYPFYAGVTFTNRAAAPFRVTPAGVLTATSGTVGGWTLAETSLTGGNATLHNSGYLSLGTGDDIARLDAFDATYRLWIGNSAAESALFKVSKAGVLTASGVSISGSITATSGTFGGWTLSATSLKDTSGLTGMSSAVTAGDDVRFWAGHATPSSAPFKVTEAGVLTASYASITGTITANAGTIGGFTVSSSDGLYSGTAGTRVQMKPGSGIWAGATAIGDAPFSVTSAGALKATSGTIAGWTLAATRLSWNDGAQGIGMATYDDTDGYAFWAGDYRPSYAEFRVSKTGALTATSATITGNITASSGTIGGFTADSTEGLYAGSGVTRVQMKPGGGFWAGATAIGDAPFRVTNAGALTATNVSITTGGGNVKLNSSGLILNYAKIASSYITWADGATSKGTIGCYLDGGYPTVAIGTSRILLSGASGIDLEGPVLASGDILHTGTKIGFFKFGSAAVTKQTVSGSRGGNAALASLLTALAAYGLITDSSS